MSDDAESPTPNPSRLREGDNGRSSSPLPQAGGAGGGPVRPFKPRDTERARELRRETTPAERKLWAYLSGKQLGVRFSRQMPVGPYFADFLCRSRKLIIELDGFSHDVDPNRDARRDAHLRSLGYSVLHFSNEEVMRNAEGVVFAIRAALAHP